jgi:Leucine-rich repeat (LRR) protein
VLKRENIGQKICFLFFQIDSWPLSFCANGLFQKNLRLLDLSGNRFKSVPFNIFRLKQLITLKLADNPELVRFKSGDQCYDF